VDKSIKIVREVFMSRLLILEGMLQIFISGTPPNQGV